MKKWKIFKKGKGLRNFFQLSEQSKEKVIVPNYFIFPPTQYQINTVDQFVTIKLLHVNPYKTLKNAHTKKEWLLTIMFGR